MRARRFGFGFKFGFGFGFGFNTARRLVFSLRLAFLTHALSPAAARPPARSCIPVAIQDDVQMPFENALRLEDFSLRIAEADVARVPAILAAVRPEEEARLAANVRRVWRRCVLGLEFGAAL